MRDNKYGGLSAGMSKGKPPYLKTNQPTDLSIQLLMYSNSWRIFHIMPKYSQKDMAKSANDTRNKYMYMYMYDMYYGTKIFSGVKVSLFNTKFSIFLKLPRC